MDKPDISLFIDTPELLLDVCREVIEKLDARNPGLQLAESEAQLKAISKAIEKLEKDGIGVPDEFRSIKINLVAELAATNRYFENLADGLEEILQDLYKRIGRLNNKEVWQQQPRSRSREPKASPEILRQNIIEALVTLGGSGHLHQVLDQMEKQLNGKLLPGDLVKRKSGEIAWRNNAMWQRFYLVKEGILKNDSPRGIWELSEDYK